MDEVKKMRLRNLGFQKEGHKIAVCFDFAAVRRFPPDTAGDRGIQIKGPFRNAAGDAVRFVQKSGNHITALAENFIAFRQKIHR